MRALIGMIAADQPAAQLLGGHQTHNALQACWIGGQPCRGTTSKFRGGIVGHGSTQTGKGGMSANGKCAACGKPRATCPADLHGGGKTFCDCKGGVHWCGIPAPSSTSCPQSVETAYEAATGLDLCPNKTQRKQHAKTTGWRVMTFVWALYLLYGFDPMKDIVIDAMHCLAKS